MTRLELSVICTGFLAWRMKEENWFENPDFDNAVKAAANEIKYPAEADLAAVVFSLTIVEGLDPKNVLEATSHDRYNPELMIALTKWIITRKEWAPMNLRAKAGRLAVAIGYYNEKGKQIVRDAVRLLYTELFNELLGISTNDKV